MRKPNTHAIFSRFVAALFRFWAYKAKSSRCRRRSASSSAAPRNAPKTTHPRPKRSTRRRQSRRQSRRQRRRRQRRCRRRRAAAAPTFRIAQAFAQHTTSTSRRSLKRLRQQKRAIRTPAARSKKRQQCRLCSQRRRKQKRKAIWRNREKTIKRNNRAKAYLHAPSSCTLTHTNQLSVSPPLTAH